MNFIKLTRTRSGKAVYINIDRIEAIGELPDSAYARSCGVVGKTFVALFDMTEEEEPYIVDETPEQILTMICEIVDANE